MEMGISPFDNSTGSTQYIAMIIHKIDNSATKCIITLRTQEPTR